VKSFLLIALLAILLFVTTFFIVTYFKVHDLPYNEMGRYFDENEVVVYDEQAVGVYGFISVVFSIGTLIMMKIVVTRFKSRRIEH
jgi:hypothetical protein